MIVHTTSLRVRYKETDQMGVVYYSNYLVWFEVARTELLRHMGHTYREIEQEMGLRMMVLEANCRYKSPARYDDFLDIVCSVTKIGNSSITFAYKVMRDQDLLTEGETLHVFTDTIGRPKRMPQMLREVLS